MAFSEATYLQKRSRQLVQRAGLRRRDALRLGGRDDLADLQPAPFGVVRNGYLHGAVVRHPVVAT